MSVQSVRWSLSELVLLTEGWMQCDSDPSLKGILILIIKNIHKLLPKVHIDCFVVKMLVYSTTVVTFQSSVTD